MANGTKTMQKTKHMVLVAAEAKLKNKRIQNKKKIKDKTNRAIVDSGANTMLMALNTPLEDGGESSNRKCWDFTGKKYIPMAKQGHVWMCFTEPNDSSATITDSADQPRGYHLLKVYTQTAAQITDNILSVSRMVKLLGFGLNLRLSGWEGFTKEDPNTGKIIKIPVFYDDADMLWYIYFSVGPTRQRAMQTARARNDVRKQVVDVTGNEWTPDICYAGNAMIRRSRRITAKEQAIDDSTVDKKDSQTGPVNSITDKDLDAISIPTDAPESIDTRRGTIVGDDANATTISNKDSKKSGGEMQMLEATETTLYQHNTSLVRPSLRPRDLKLNKEQRHDKLGHFGTHRNCIHCQQVKSRPRQVYKNPTPVYDHIPGRSIHMDSMYLDVQSRHGDWYCAPAWDDNTGYLSGIFMDRRNEAGDKIIDWVIRHRKDPELNCPKFCTILWLDPAGEWSRGSPEFMQKMTNNEIDIRQLPSNVDKRALGKGEMAVQITKMHMQAIMLSTRLEEDMWREAVEYAWHVHGLLCLTRNASPKGNGPRPLQQLSRNNIDAEECDRRKDYSIPPGSLALVHLPGKHGGAYNLSNSKYGRAVRMERDTVLFESLDDKRTITKSKHFQVVNLEPGVSALQKVGIERKLRLPKACLPRDDRPKHITLVKLNYLYHAETEKHMATTKGITATTDIKMPTILTMDAAGRILEQHGSILRPTEGFCLIVPEEKLTIPALDMYKAHWLEVIDSRPLWLIGHEVHQHFDVWDGVARGIVEDYDEENKYWRIRWETDKKATDFDAEDMRKYCIERIHGKSKADGGHALMLRARQKAIWETTQPGSIAKTIEAVVDDPNWYKSQTMQSWADICGHCQVPPDKHREYLLWIRENHKLGNKEEFKTDDSATFFPTPLKIKKQKANQNAFKQLVTAGTKFPRVDGGHHSASWMRHIQYVTAESRRADDTERETRALARVAFMKMATDCLRDAQPDVTTHEEWKDIDFELRISYAADKTSTKTWDDIENEFDEKMVDSVTGLPIPPKSSKELDSWPDGSMKRLWTAAEFKEWMGLNSRGCFEHDVSHTELRQRGIIPKHKIVGMRMLYDTKTRDGVFDKAKNRCVVQGHKGNIRRGIDYDTVFAAAPSLESGRMLMALYAALGWTSFVYDINQAYLIGEAAPGQTYPLRYPEGPIRDAHRDKDGNERYMVLKGNVYGVPTAARVFAIERDRLMLEELPRVTGWKVSIGMYESCMYKIQTDKGIVFINTHTDDCDCLAEHPDDAKRVFDECNRLFAHEQSDGITPSGNDFLLGNSRKKKVVNGVRSIILSQCAKISELWEEYKDNRKGKRDPKHPYPYNEDHPDLNDQLQATEVDKDEYDAVLRDGQYRALTGSLLWITRNNSPALMYGTSITTKCMSKPSLKALGSAHHLLHYAELHKERGIKFNSHGNLEPICYIDSGFNQAKMGSKPQYSFVIMWLGGPIVWKSKRHDQVPLSVSEAEFMTLTHAYVWVKWVREMIIDFGFPEWVEQPTVMLTDNRNARDWGNESMITDGNRHIDRRYMLIREKVKLGHIAIVWMSGDWNISDTGTKAIDIPTTERLTPLLCGYGELPIPAQTKILFGPVERPERRESTNKAIPLKILNA